MSLKLLISGFEPFGGEKINPSFEAVKLLPDEIDGNEICKICLPVEYGNAGKLIKNKIEEYQPDVVILCGQAGGRADITPELVGINYMESSIADNAGVFGKGEKILLNGENAYFSTLPVKEIVSAIKALGIRAKLSLSAGAFVCNDVLYRTLDYLKGRDTLCGFIHVPFIKSQGEPYIELEDIAKALKEACSVCLASLKKG